MAVVEIMQQVWGKFQRNVGLLLPQARLVPAVLSRQAIAGLDTVLEAESPDPSRRIDDPTWDDLLVDACLDQLAGETSLFARQVLYRRLRVGLDDDAFSLLAVRLQQLQHMPATRQASLQQACQPMLGAETDISELVYQNDTRHDLPTWRRYLAALPLMFVLSVSCLLASPWAWLPLALSFGGMLAIQQYYHVRIEQWGRAMQSLQQLLRSVSLLAATGTHGALVLHSELPALAGMAGSINRDLTRSPLANTVPGLSAYLDWFFLANVRHYFKGVQSVRQHRAWLRQCFELAANLEADALLARVTAHVGTCAVERSPARELSLQAFVHPLLPDPAPLSIALNGQGAFVSGQNGVGKSTLLRALGLNLLWARAFGFCHAEQARLPAVPVISSMQGEDSLLGGESLYLAELRRAQQILAASERPCGAIILIDEIFRGTNYLESISAAAAVLDTLSQRALVVVSSHNLVLAALLAQQLQPWCVVRRADGHLALQAGVLEQTNGLALLTARGFDSAIASKADHVMQWLSQYLHHPAHAGSVLSAMADAG